MDDESSRETTWARANLGLLATVVAFAFVIVKVFAVSRFETETAVALVSTAGATSVIVGALTSSLTGVLSFAFLFELLSLIDTLSGGRRLFPFQRHFAWNYAIAAAAVSLIPWDALAINVAAALAYLVVRLLAVRRRRRRGEEPSPSSFLPGSIYVYAGVGLIPLLVTSAVMWLPAERLSIASDRGDDVIVGYVVALDQGWATILRDEDRVIVRVDAESVISRTLCAAAGGPARSLAQLVFRDAQPPYPRCDTGE